MRVDRKAMRERGSQGSGLSAGRKATLFRQHPAYHLNPGGSPSGQGMAGRTAYEYVVIRNRRELEVVEADFQLHAIGQKNRVSERSIVFELQAGCLIVEPSDRTTP